MREATQQMSTLDAFKDYMGEIQDLRTVQGLLGWDLETMMPPKGAEIRAQQMATLAKLSHAMLTSEQMGQYLCELSNAELQQSLSPVDKALVREATKEYERERKIPPSMVRELTETTTQAHPIWVEARQTNQFANFATILGKIVKLSQQMADIMGYEGSPYNALLDLYEPGLTVDKLDILFADLKAQLVPLVHAIQNAPNKPDTSFLSKHTFDPDKQMEFTLTVLNAMGFDFAAGRQDKAAHPFTMGMGPQDVRLTTRVFESDVVSCLFSSIHEGGHGLYEQGIDPQLSRTFLDGGASLGIHESQSRMWENLVGRSRAFWQHYFPQLQNLFPQALQSVTAEDFYRAINQVRPSFIRVEADEVTYNLHILVRYEIEKDMIEGRLPVAKVPEAWNAKYQEYLGITPDTDTHGALQDVHWSHGSFGYFPTYTLGNLYASQFFRTAKQAMPSLEADMAQGQLKPLKHWLNAQIHKNSKIEQPAEIVQRVTGEPLNAQYFVDYLWAKYGEIYGVQRG